MKRLSLSLLLLSLLGLTVRAQPEVPAEVDRLARQYAANPHNRGLIVGIIRNGTQYTKAYGETQKGNGQPPKPSRMIACMPVREARRLRLVTRATDAPHCPFLRRKLPWALNPLKS